MKNMIFYLLTIILVSCTPDSSGDEISVIESKEETPSSESQEETPSEQTPEETPSNQTMKKDLLEVIGEGEFSSLYFNYKDGMIDKIWASPTSDAIQVVYNPNGKISRQYREQLHDQRSNAQNFEWEVATKGDNYLENIYEDGKLKFTKYSDFTEEYVYHNDLVIRIGGYSYEYNDKDELTTIIYSGPSFSRKWDVKFDDKVNPFYKMWKEISFVPWNYWERSDGLLLDFYPHNLVSLIESDGDIEYEIFYTYDEDDYPITSRVFEDQEDIHRYNFNYN